MVVLGDSITRCDGGPCEVLSLAVMVVRVRCCHSLLWWSYQMVSLSQRSCEMLMEVPRCPLSFRWCSWLLQ